MKIESQSGSSDTTGESCNKRYLVSMVSLGSPSGESVGRDGHGEESRKPTYLWATDRPDRSQKLVL